MAHAIGLAALMFAGACAAPPPPRPRSLQGMSPGWFYIPGPYTTIQTSPGGPLRTRVSPETNGTWIVTIGDPPTIVHAVRLPDGRPATASVAETDRNETVVFDPPLALVPQSGEPSPATVQADIALYDGLSADQGRRPKRTGTATRTFFGIEPSTWNHKGLIYPAQLMRSELLLDFGAAKVRRRYQSLAVQQFGIVKETVTERLTFLGVRVGGSERTTELAEFIP